MSDVSIFRFPAPTPAPNGMDSSAFQQTTLDPDASARLAAIDSDFHEPESESQSQTEDEILAAMIADSAAAATS